MLQEMARLLVKDIKDRKLVPALRVPVSKVVRCLCTDVFRREDSPTEIHWILRQSISVLLRDSITIQRLPLRLCIEAGVIKNPKDGVKILGNGELTKKLTVKAKRIQRECKG